MAAAAALPDYMLTAQRAVDAAYALHDDVVQPNGEADFAQRVAAAYKAAINAVEAAEKADVAALAAAMKPVSRSWADAVDDEDDEEDATVAAPADAGEAAATAAEPPDAVAVRHRTTEARLLYLRGKALACSEEGRKGAAAERHLADAVKLDPRLSDAWNCLGECFWARGNLELARHTFQAALAFERGAATLCHLSMLLRTLSQREGTADTMLAESVALAKESVRLNTSSSKSWAGLGAAHLSLHVHVSSEAEDLHLANRAFKQAAKMDAGRDATILVNHATVLAMLDSPDEALQLFTAAHAVDPGLGALLYRADAWAAVNRCADALTFFREKGSKRISQLVKGLAAPPRNDGSAPPTRLASLQLGQNSGKTVLVKVVLNVPHAGGGPVTVLRSAAAHQTLVVADAAEQLMALTVYAVRGLPNFEAGSTLEVHEPMLHRIEASASWEPETPAAGFHLLHVEQPASQLRIDGGLRAARSRNNSGGR